MEDLKLLLIDRLKSKGMDPALIPAFLKALTSLIAAESGIDPARINQKLLSLGWDEVAIDYVEGGGKLRQLAARNCDTGSISDPLSIFLSIENLCFSASSSDWQRRRFFLPPGLAQTVALPVGLYDVTPVGQAV